MKIDKFLIAGIMSLGILTSCGSDESAPNSTNATKTASVTLNIGTGVTRTTRTSGTIPASSTNLSLDENHISKLEFVYFNSSTKKILAFTSRGSTDIKIDATTTSLKFTDAAIPVSADSLYVIANSSGVDISSKAIVGNNMSDVNTVVAKLSATSGTPTATNTQVSKDLPMVAKVATGLAINNASVNVTAALNRIVARVALRSVDMSSKMPSGCTFTPTEVFMYNVTTGATYIDNTCLGTSNFIAGDAEYTGTGLGTVASPITTGVNGTTNAYLSTGYFGTNPITNYFSASANSVSNETYFYVFPNFKTSPTTLELKGIWNDGTTQSVVYYHIPINYAPDANTTLSGSSLYTDKDHILKIYPNVAYTVDLVITKKGSPTSDPLDGVTGTATVNMTVTDWAAVNQAVTW